MTTINTYLTFNGNCEAAFLFYQSVFGGEFRYLGRYSEMPAPEGAPALTTAEKNKIMHISLPISTETQLLGCDTPLPDSFQKGNNFSISITTATKEEADRLVAALASNGQITMPMSTTFWGSYFGMLTDQFGINWMISVNL